MRKKTEVLLQQIAENSRGSIVFLVTGYTDEQRTGFASKHTEVPTYVETGTGFFVEPDTIVTTIEVLAGAIAVVAISNDYFREKIGHRRFKLFGKRKPPQINEEDKYTIEGVTAFDVKNNLVLLKTDETGIPLPLGNSDTAEIDEKVYTLGYGNQMKYTRAAGTLQSKYRKDTWLQLKTQFFPGNGGAPVLNSKSEVIGVEAYGTESAAKGDDTTIATAISSNVLKVLLTNSEEVRPLHQFQTHSRVRAYALEAQAEKKGKLYDNREAIKCYNAALKLNPDLVEIYFKCGILKTRIGDLAGALKDFNRILQINSEHIFAYNNRASVKGNLGNPQAALNDLHKAIALSPEYITARINLGTVKCSVAAAKTETGDIVEAQRYYQEAIDDYTKALSLNPRNRSAHRQRKAARRALWALKLQEKNNP